MTGYTIDLDRLLKLGRRSARTRVGFSFIFVIDGLMRRRSQAAELAMKWAIWKPIGILIEQSMLPIHMMQSEYCRPIANCDWARQRARGLVSVWSPPPDERAIAEACPWSRPAAVGVT